MWLFKLCDVTTAIHSRFLRTIVANKQTEEIIRRESEERKAYIATYEPITRVSTT